MEKNNFMNNNNNEFMAFVQQLMVNQRLMARFKQQAHKTLAEQGLQIPPHIELEICDETEGNIFFVMPYVDSDMTEQELMNITAAQKITTVSSASSVSSIMSAGTIVGDSLGTFSTSSTIATLGSALPVKNH